MYLYNLTLQKAGGIYQSISGSFTSPKTQEIVVSKGTMLELFQIDQSGKLKTLISMDLKHHTEGIYSQNELIMI